MQSTVLFIGDCSIGGLYCLFTGSEDRIVYCPVREACGQFSCLRAVRLMVVCIDCVSNDEITTIMNRARKELVPVLLI